MRDLRATGMSYIFTGYIGEVGEEGLLTDLTDITGFGT